MSPLTRLGMWTAALALVFAPRLGLAAEAGHAEPGIINLNVTLLIQAINFLILIALLSRFLFRPLTGFVRERAEGIRRSLQEAAAAREAAAHSQEEMRAEMLKMQREAGLLREQAQRDAEVERERLQAAARTEADRLIAQARAEIAAETQRARVSLRQEAVDLSLAAAERLLGRALTGEDQQRLAEQYIRELERTN
ncbi:MAG TPA: F0F1 ATP synthase subunit B [Candidatus Sulfotelmatobacter sp.]|nr:F0F1 ATP synthase subunit B [Candidatus Sulfotelmatobacter sp.]